MPCSLCQCGADRHGDDSETRTIEGRIVGVSDGDTVTLLVCWCAGGQRDKMRAMLPALWLALDDQREALAEWTD